MIPRYLIEKKQNQPIRGGEGYPGNQALPIRPEVAALCPDKTQGYAMYSARRLKVPARPSGGASKRGCSAGRPCSYIPDRAALAPRQNAGF